jgi:hypothetical protein
MEDGNEFNKGQLTQQVTDHERRLGKNDEEHKDMWDTINAIRNRPPVWCTVVLGIILAIAAWFAKSAIGS